MIKLVLFDLDGVLIDAKKIHYAALNEALGPEYEIDMQEHLTVYDGLKTTQKLEMLTERKGLPVKLHKKIHKDKQKRTRKYIQELMPNSEIKKLFVALENEGIQIGVCSNAIRRTVLTALAKTHLIEHCSVVLSNEDVQNSKPHPEIYWKAMSILNRLPEETLIVEDSPPGLLAAQRSRANYMRVASPSDVTRQNVFNNLKSKKLKVKWVDKKLNVLIPMAGAGSRFATAGYTFPKPLIDINGKPMIQLVVENLGLDANYHFVVQKEHRQKYNLDAMLSLIAPGCKVIEVDGVTEGAACTSLLAREFIDNNNPLFFANSDQFVDWNVMEFMYTMNEKNADGGIVTFESTHPKWSFAKTDDMDRVLEVAEKNPISNQATVGFYYWKKGADFCKYADSMIDKDIRVNNEFYVCPVFNQAILDGKDIRTYKANQMWGLGTPEDLENYLKEFS